MGEDWRRTQKYDQLDKWTTATGATWQELQPDLRNTWLTEGQQDDYQSMTALGIKGAKDATRAESIFQSFSLGIVSARDTYVYNSDIETLTATMKQAVEAYNESLSKYRRLSVPRPAVADFIDSDDDRLKWSRQTKASLEKFEANEFDPSCKSITIPFAS